MKYFFVLGSNPTLSLAEISAVFDLKQGKPDNIIFLENVLILNTEKEFDATALIARLGGTIKIGLIEFESENNKDVIVNEVQWIIDKKATSGKFHFGISAYSRKPMNSRTIGMEIKKHLRDKEISCRFVVSREATLSSVVVEQNKLLRNGIEIVLINDKGKIFGGHTLAVQPFKELSYRDYGRPARDDRSGMLPPKLAQIMINLSGLFAITLMKEGLSSIALAKEEGGVLLDPFCGSGTILTEAALMGYQNLVGTDISPKAIEDTRKNMEWIIRKWELGTCRPARRVGNLPAGEASWELKTSDAKNISKEFKDNSIDTIITEPYLGPQRGKIDFQKVKKELEELYRNSLKEFYKILKPGGRVVMVFPIFQASNIKLQADLNGFKIINPLPDFLAGNKNIELTSRNTIVYGREGQRVWREIVILEKQI
jgi:tRNA G10  N-methylase Trm11